MSKRREEQLRELEDPKTWEEAGEVHPAVKSPRAVVSVAFPRDEFGRVAEAARAEGVKISAFIREAAVERAERGDRGRGPAIVMMSATQSGLIAGSFTASAAVRVEMDKTGVGPHAVTVTA